jgi:hypothetical protein
MPSLLYAGENGTIAIYTRAANGDLARRATVALPWEMRSFCFSPDKYHLYVATGGTPAGSDQCEVLTFSVDQTNGDLVPTGAPVALPKVPAYCPRPPGAVKRPP